MKLAIKYSVPAGDEPVSLRSEKPSGGRTVAGRKDLRVEGAEPDTRLVDGGGVVYIGAGSVSAIQSTARDVQVIKLIPVICRSRTEHQRRVAQTKWKAVPAA